MECKVCEYSCGCIETCKLKSSECYQNKKSRMKDIRKKAIKFEAEMYGVATNQFVDGFINGYQQGKEDGAREFAKWICDGVTPKENPFVNWMALETLRDGSCYGIEVEELLEEYEKEQSNDNYNFDVGM